MDFLGSGSYVRRKLKKKFHSHSNHKPILYNRMTDIFFGNSSLVSTKETSNRLSFVLQFTRDIFQISTERNFGNNAHVENLYLAVV
jgi:hypothetical protein